MAKKNVSVVGILAVTLVFGFLFAGCATSQSLDRLNPVGGHSYQDIKVPNKDFESKGLVFAEYVSEGDGAGSEHGEVYTYYKLLQEAKKLGADAIVNVVIEGKQEGQTKKIFGIKTKTGKTQITWYGSATAIKYTTTITTTSDKSTPLADSSDNTGSGSGSGSGKKKTWWNPLTWFK